MKKIILAILLAQSSAFAHEDHSEALIEQAIEYRSGLMEVFAWNFKRMGEVVKGEKDYQADQFSRWANDLNVAAHLDLLAGFPEDSDDEDESDAKSEIWLDWDHFTAKLDQLRQQTKKLAQTSHQGDLAAIKAQYAEVGKACKSCHKAFKK